MPSCCRLGDEYFAKNNILYESNNFFITPAVGQMGIEGYLLLCSKKHYEGIGGIPAEFEAELEEILKKTKQVIKAAYDSEILVFEHGPRIGCHKGGGCLDHAHLHLVPTVVDVRAFLVKIFKLEKIKNFGRLREVFSQKQSSYLFLETQDNMRYVAEVDFPLPPQYLRQVIAAGAGISAWDWRLYPGRETFIRTLARLKGKFEK